MTKTWFKPPGITVFPPHGSPGDDCVLRRLLEAEPWRGQVAWPSGFAGGIAHRLDTSTSGAILLADSVGELQTLRAYFREHRFIKTYLLLTPGTVPWDQNVCDKPLAHDKKRAARMVVQRGKHTVHRGKWYPAVTRFERIRGKLFKATMSSGVMHQVRVHASFLGIPILGDRLYGGGPTPPDAPPGVTFFLHHVGLRGPAGVGTESVPDPPWMRLADAGLRA